MVFNQALDSWDTDDFARVFKQTFNALSLKDLPLMDCCTHSGVIDEASIESTILTSSATQKTISLKIGVFFSEILSGCACSDDPSQAMILENSYCELLVEINRSDAQIKFTYASYAS
ncbi:MAG TPA: hypothetical protein EYO47_03070 [Candidatus Thioglobus sp.]|jgi:hypothetical protein|nr:hypothetical protein [Candidatus Thioglobus sp.]HIB97119.1 hypothetical protein [Candidatus Thioglobus sp.]